MEDFVPNFKSHNLETQSNQHYLHSFSHAHRSRPQPFLSTLSTLQFPRYTRNFELLNEWLSTLSTLIFTCPQIQRPQSFLSTLSTLQFSRPIRNFELLNDALTTLSTLNFTCPQIQSPTNSIYPIYTCFFEHPSKF